MQSVTFIFSLWKNIWDDFQQIVGYENSILLENFDKSRIPAANTKQLNSAAIPEKHFRELVFSSVFEKKYLREKEELYKEDFQIAWTLTERK
jgi:hypothetical protein